MNGRTNVLFCSGVFSQLIQVSNDSLAFQLHVFKHVSAFYFSSFVLEKSILPDRERVELGRNCHTYVESGLV